MFDSIERAAKFIQNLVIIGGIFAAGFSLVHGQYDRRVDRTVAFTKDYSSSVRKYYLDLLTPWNDYATEQHFYDKDEAGQKQVIKKFFETDKARQQNLDNVLDFYDTLYICVDRRSCDRNSALDFFRPSITSLYEIFAFRIFYLRETQRDPSVGKGLEQLYRMDPESWWSQYI